MSSAPLEDKLRAFNFNVVTINGHDFDQIESAVQAFHAETEKPTCIILDTVKGTGVSYMTNAVAWHGKGPNDEEYQVAMNELNAAYAALTIPPASPGHRDSRCGIRFPGGSGFPGCPGFADFLGFPGCPDCPEIL